jgi:hypothetical protein
MKSMKRILSLLLIFIFAKSAFASICLFHPPEIIDFYQTEAIFIGKVLSVKRFYGIPRTDVNWNVKYKIVEFEVQKSYKGVEAGKKVSIINPFGSSDWADIKLKKGQQWAVYATMHNGNLSMFNGCGPWSEQLKSQADEATWDKDLTALKDRIERDKQAIAFRIFNEMKGEAAENIEINIDGNNQQITAHTDKDGCFYLPQIQPGEYQIKIKFPMKAMLFYTSFKYGREHHQESDGRDTITYKINLQSGEFFYHDLTVGLYK